MRILCSTFSKCIYSTLERLPPHTEHISRFLHICPEKHSCTVLWASLPQMYNIFPWLMEHLPGHQHTVFAQGKELREFIKMKIQEHKETLDPSSPRDYIDCFLIRMDQVGKNFRNILFVTGTLPNPLSFMLKLSFVCIKIIH